MPRGRKKIDNPVPNPMKAVRLTFRVDQKLIAKFKALAALKKMKIEELGRIALENKIKKAKASMRLLRDDN